jgi:hypothetical protein
MSSSDDNLLVGDEYEGEKDRIKNNTEFKAKTIKKNKNDK